MLEYKLSIKKSAQKQLDKLPESIAGMLIEAIHELKFNPRPQGSIRLKGREGYRIRKGDYRIIYGIYDKILVIEIIAVGNRRDIYD